MGFRNESSLFKMLAVVIGRRGSVALVSGALINSGFKVGFSTSMRLNVLIKLFKFVVHELYQEFCYVLDQ